VGPAGGGSVVTDRDDINRPKQSNSITVLGL